jgi:hypothetical protein
LAPGNFAADSLSNGGERIVLLGSLGQTIQDFSFDDVAPWPTTADGGGHSLEIIDAFGDPSSGANWRASFYVGGSPGTDGLPPVGMPGDFDDDDDVDGSDFLAWQRGLGMTSSAARADGDADGDQDVDANDLGMWQSNFGDQPALAATLFASSTAASGQSMGTSFLSAGQWIVAEPAASTRPSPRQGTREQAVDDAFESGDEEFPKPSDLMQTPVDMSLSLTEVDSPAFDLALEEGLTSELNAEIACVGN